jgi:hypothetical protein
MPDTAKYDPRLRIPQQEESVHARPDPAVLARLLEEWMQGDEAEQRETFEFLRQSLDEGRPAGYKLFS